MGSQFHPDTTYAKSPLRRIVGRVVYYSPPMPPFPEGYFVEPYVRLECGHEDRNAGQKARVRCWQCVAANQQET